MGDTAKRLVTFARRGDLDEIQKLIQEGVDINTTNDSSHTALSAACESGQTEVTEYLLDRGASVTEGANPLVGAVRNGRYYCAKVLLKRHANANCASLRSESPISIAAEKHNYRIVLLLLQHGAVAPPSLDCMALELVKSAALKHAKVITKLVDEKIISTTSESTCQAVFDYAFRCGLYRVAERMLADDDWTKLGQKSCSVAAFHCAKQNWPTILSRLLQRRREGINTLTDGQTPLYVACKEGHGSIVNLLLANGADPNVPNDISSKELKLPIQVAVQRANVGIFKVLLEKGAILPEVVEPIVPSITSPLDEWDWEHHTSPTVKTKCVENMLSMIRTLLEHEISVNATSDKGDTALCHACRSQQLEIVEVLLEGGADVNLTTKSLYPLVAACRPESAINVAIVNLLLEYGADVKVADTTGNTPLHYALYGCSSTSPSAQHSGEVSEADSWKLVVDVLLDKGASVNVANNGTETPLFLATSEGMVDVVRKMLRICQGDPDKASKSAYPLAVACELKSVQLVDVLLTYKANPDHGRICCPGESSEKVPLTIAIEKSCHNIVRSLLKAGAQVEARTSSKKSLLCLAVEKLIKSSKKSRQRIVDLLLAHGADVNVRTPDGHSLLYFLANKRNTELLLVFDQYGSTLNQQEKYKRVGGLLSHRVHTLLALTKYDDKQGFIMDLLRAGAGFQLLGCCCLALATSTKGKSILLCQAVMVAGYEPSAEELEDLQEEIGTKHDTADILKHLLGWIDLVKKQVPCLRHLCRTVVRRQLSTAASFRSILPAIRNCDLPDSMKLYLQFKGEKSMEM